MSKQVWFTHGIPTSTERDRGFRVVGHVIRARGGSGGDVDLALSPDFFLESAESLE